MLAFPPDATFVVQIVSFFVLLFVLNRLLFRPYMEVLEQRSERSEGTLRAAAGDRRRAEEIKAQLEGEMARARAEAGKRAEALRRQARAEQQAILEEAEREAAERLARLREGIERARGEAAAQLQSEARGLASRVVEVLLGERAAS